MMNKGVRHQLLLLALGIREGFIALVPYLIAASAGLILFHLAGILGFQSKTQQLWSVLDYMKGLLPILIIFSVAYHFARVSGVDPAMSSLLALTVFFSVYPISAVLALSGFSSFNVLLCPVVTTYILIFLEKIGLKRTPRYTSLSQGVMTIYQYTWLFLLALLLGYIFIYGSEKLAVTLGGWLKEVLVAYDWSLELMLVLRSVLTPFLFFFGLHGPIVMDMSLGNQYMAQPVIPNMMAGTFYNTFVIFGGTGTCLALAIAVLWNGRDQHAIKTTKVAMPFLLFNVSEILVYGLPVIFNRWLFIPFICVPAINLFLAYVVIVKWGLFTASGIDVPWITPIFLNAYMATDGNVGAVFFQVLLITIDVLVYLFFVKKYIATQVSSERFSRLNNALNLTVAFEGKQEWRFEEAQSYIINAHSKTSELVDLIVQNQLVMFYQPKINVQLNSCQHFEALLRLQLKSGEILPPDFLGNIERAGLVPVIDMWVCRQVASDLNLWREQGFRPYVSVNIHPHSLEDSACVASIIEHLPPAQVELEFVEKAFINSDTAKKNVALLISHGYKLAVDDFGSGYSSLNNLNEVPAHCIKIDKKLVDGIHHARGQIMYHHIVAMCKALGYVTVAEGVEKAEQLALVKEAGVDFVQGWYFAKAMPFEEVKGYSEQFAKNNPS